MSEPDDATKPTADAVERAVAALDIATRQPAVRPIPRWVIVAGVPVMVSVAVASAWFLLGTGATTVELDAIRTAGTLGVGFGGVVALWLAVRRQRSTELDLLQKYEAHRLAELVAAHNREIANRAAVHAEHDSRERRLTDLYLKAVEQLGSEKAAVRHGGLYALERVAQDNPEQRQTVVSVLCAYLRAPVELPDDYRLPDAARSRRGWGIHRPLAQANKARFSPRACSSQAVLPSRVELDNGARQELEVRLTAQQILHKHFKVGEDLEHPSDEFWADMDLDLRGATLVNFDLRHRTRLQGADFVGATFVGNALFEGTNFTGPAWFEGANFTSVASFDRARFGRETSFSNAHFDGLAWFNGTHFDGVARFVAAGFRGDASTAAALVVRVMFAGHGEVGRGGGTIGRGLGGVVATRPSAGGGFRVVDGG